MFSEDSGEDGLSTLQLPYSSYTVWGISVGTETGVVFWMALCFTGWGMRVAVSLKCRSLTLGVIVVLLDIAGSFTFCTDYKLHYQ